MEMLDSKSQEHDVLVHTELVSDLQDDGVDGDLT